MKRFKFEMIFFFISAISGVSAYFITGSKFLALGVGLAYLLSLLFFIAPMYRKAEIKRIKQEEAYQFINRFSITLSSSSSVTEAYSRASEDIADEEFRLINGRIGYLSTLQKIVYLSDFFLTSFYDVFVSVFKIYEEEGGDFLKTADSLLKEMNTEMENASASYKESLKKLGEFITLWVLSLAILLFMRVSLNSLYSYMNSSLAYTLISLVYFVTLLVSIIVFSCIYTGEKIFNKRKENAA